MKTKNKSCKQPNSWYYFVCVFGLISNEKRINKNFDDRYIIMKAHIYLFINV